MENIAINKFRKLDNIFQCPICGKKLVVTKNGSFICKKKHCFDLSSKGYINFISSQSSTNKYNKRLFECRNHIFKLGYYNKILDELQKTIIQYFPHSQTLKILDIGCGEGFYCDFLNKKNIDFTVLGLDNNKDAIQIACKQNSKINWIVGNLADIPLQNNTIDILLNILTPANYTEFSRILKKDGIIIKIIPGNNYLKEIRNCVVEQLDNKDYSNESTIQYFKKHIKLLTIKKISYTLQISQEELRFFLEMTPMTFNVNISKIDTTTINEITIDMDFLIGRI